MSHQEFRENFAQNEEGLFRLWWICENTGCANELCLALSNYVWLSNVWILFDATAEDRSSARFTHQSTLSLCGCLWCDFAIINHVNIVQPPSTSTQIGDWGKSNAFRSNQMTSLLSITHYWRFWIPLPCEQDFGWLYLYYFQDKLDMAVVLGCKSEIKLMNILFRPFLHYWGDIGGWSLTWWLDMRCAGSLFTVGRVYTAFPRSVEIHLFNGQCKSQQLAGRASLQKLFQS